MGLTLTQTAVGLLMVPAALFAGGCVGSTGAGGSSSNRREYPLNTLPTATVSIGDHVFRVWLAQESAPRVSGRVRTVVEEGLMFVPPEELADDQGMLFVFTDEEPRGFWMLNTITPLDIAFARMNGTIVKIWQMPPGTWQTFSSIEPAMFALEVKQGTFERLGIREGDRMIIPNEVLHTPGQSQGK